MTRSPQPALSSAWCSFSSLGRMYSVRLDSVCQVVQVDRLIRLPMSPPRLVGLCKLGRDVIPVFVPFSDPVVKPAPAGQTQLVLVLRATKGQWGFLVDPGGVHVHEDSPAGSVQAPSLEPPSVDRENPDLVSVDPEATWHELRKLVNVGYYPRPAVEGRAPTESV
jgi:hypothetical protein